MPSSRLLECPEILADSVENHMRAPRSPARNVARADVVQGSRVYNEIYEELERALRKRSAGKDLIKQHRGTTIRLGIKFTNFSGTCKTSIVKAAIAARGFKAATGTGPNPAAPIATAEDFENLVKLFLERGQKRTESAFQLILKGLRRKPVNGLTVYKAKVMQPRGKNAASKGKEKGNSTADTRTPVNSVDGGRNDETLLVERLAQQKADHDIALKALNERFAERIAEQRAAQNRMLDQLNSNMSSLVEELNRVKAGQSQIAGAMSKVKSAEALKLARGTTSSNGEATLAEEEARSRLLAEAEKKRQEHARRAEEKSQEDARRAKEKSQEDARRAEEKRQQAEEKRQEDARRAEEKRQQAEEKRQEDARRAEEKRQEDARRVEEKKQRAEEKRQEDARRAEAKMKKKAAAEEEKKKKKAVAARKAKERKKKAKEKEERTEAAKILLFDQKIEKLRSNEASALDKVATLKQAIAAAQGAATGKNPAIATKRKRWKIADERRKKISARIRTLKREEKERQTRKRKAAAQEQADEREKRRLEEEARAVEFWRRFLQRYRPAAYKGVRTTTMLSKVSLSALFFAKTMHLC
jgi:hypothetical protein